MADAIVAGWLADLDLGSCIATFRDEGIDSDALSFLTDEQLVQLGVRRMGDRSKLRAKALGSMPGAAPLKQQMATPAPAPGADPRGVAAAPAAPQAQQQLPLQKRSTHAGNRAAGQAPDYVPEHLQVLKRLSLSPNDSHKTSGGARRSHASEAGTDADKALALSFILAGGPLEKYRQGGKSKAHKKFIKILPDRKMAYDAKAVGPITGVKEGGAEFHTTDEEVIARSFTIVLEGDVDVHIIAPSLKDKRSWVAGIGHLVTGTTLSSSSTDAHGRPSSSKHSSSNASRRSAGGAPPPATSSSTKTSSSTAVSTAKTPPSNDTGMRLPIPSSSGMDAPPSTATPAFTGARSQHHHAHTSSSSTASMPHPALTSNNVNNNNLSSTAPSQNAARITGHSQVDAPASARQSSAPGAGSKAVSTSLSSNVQEATQSDVLPPPRIATAASGASGATATTAASGASGATAATAAIGATATTAASGAIGATAASGASGATAATAASGARSASSLSSSIQPTPASTASATNPAPAPAPSSSSSSSTLPSDRFVMLDDGLAPLSRPTPNAASSSSSSSRPAPDAPSPLPVPATPPPRAAQPRNPPPPTSVSQAVPPTTSGEDDEGEAKPEQWRVSDAGLKTCGGSVLKSKDPEEFAVALMSHSIEPGSGTHEWELEWSGPMHWCGVGVASGCVRTRGSLRRSDVRNMAWFWHSKGFLCNGDEFVEWDGVPGYAERERITVTYDSNQGILRFASGPKRTSVPGAISGIKGPVLPMVYTDGQHITCSLIVAPHKK